MARDHFTAAFDAMSEHEGRAQWSNRSDDPGGEICQVIQSAMKDAKIEASTARTTVATALALHTQALAGIEEDIRKIFKRLDRRHETRHVTNGRREEDLDD